MLPDIETGVSGSPDKIDKNKVKKNKNEITIAVIPIDLALFLEVLELDDKTFPPFVV